MIRTRSSQPRPALSLGSVALILAGCTGPPAPPADLASLLDTDLPAAERSCLEQACADVVDAASLATCRAESCPAREDAWSVVPTRVRYDGEMAYVQARLSYEAGGYGAVSVPRTSEAYVGCTLITTDGREIDLAVTTVFPGDLERPFTLNTSVGADVRDLIFGVWDRKIEPCDSDRMGCKQYGFLLDGSLATWPPNVYSEGIRQRIPPPTLSVRFVDSGLGSGFSDTRDKLLATLREELAVYGSTVETVQSMPAASFVAGSTIGIADEHDALIAKRLIQALPSGAATATPLTDAPADFVVTLSGDAETFAEVAAACADQRDDAYDSCVAGL